VKILATGQKEPRRFPSGPKMTPTQMVAGVRELAEDWKYDVVSIGYPGPVVKDRIATEPNNLGPGWTRFDFNAAFKRPVKVINDAAMQALGSYRGGTMLFLGFGHIEEPGPGAGAPASSARAAMGKAMRAAARTAGNIFFIPQSIPGRT